MDFDETRQAELERDERWLASFATPGPSAKTVAQIRDAVRTALDEEWLAEIPTPAPPRSAVDGTKAAVRQALAGSSRSIRYRGLAALSAAAVIAAAVGLSRFHMTTPTTPTTPTESLSIGDSFVAAWGAIEDAGDFLDSLTTDMAWLDAEINAWATHSGDRTDELELESLEDRIDRIFASPDYFVETS